MADMTDAQGWRRVAGPGIAAWAAAARPVAEQAVTSSAEAWRCGGTWFVGLDALPNGPDGAIGGAAFPWAELGLSPEPLHPAQLSVTRPGYPRQGEEETEAAFRFRLTRDAAHLDGLLPVGPQKRRMVKEPHGWIVGLPLNRADADAAPLVVWEGSHRLIGAALRAAFTASEGAPDTHDITEAYQAARREVFDTCPRIELPGDPGTAVILHRHLIHGVARWRDGAEADPPGRMIAYFRPLLPSIADWLREDAA
ncbi:hypothetical protein C0V75_08265 [Tabrizicola sp. TH137]|uniref:hypothetical protein n=1 Tax=Tabrizicola sp. TH137 TaxID=2067452 RepID=UPI000C7AF5FF|nr:hypothetical protein [Tabrizicola sp. TH137]PLL13731.1 hypothetical protein C0V75_08265 [Tabrizicola sp. TH137]